MTPFPQPWLRGGEPATAKDSGKWRRTGLGPGRPYCKSMSNIHPSGSCQPFVWVFASSAFNLAYSSCCYIDQGQIEPCIDTQFVSDTRAKGSAHVCEDKFGTCHVATLTGKKLCTQAYLDMKEFPKKFPHVPTITKKRNQVFPAKRASGWSILAEKLPRPPLF